MKVKDEKELGKALHDGENSIEIESDLAKKVIKIKATGNVAWGVLIASIVVAIPLVIATVASAGAATPVTAPGLLGVMGTSIATLGVGTCFSAVSIAAGGAIAAGGVGAVSAGVAALNKLRDYKLIRNGEKVTLRKK